MKTFAGPLVARLLLVLPTGHVFAQARQGDVQSCAQRPGYGDPRISWVRLVPEIGCDQKRIWTFPARVIKGKSLIPTFAVIGTTAELVASDPHTEGPLLRNNSFHTFNNVFSSTNTAVLIAAVPTVMYITGLATHDSYAKKTALLAGEAVADVEIVDLALKGVTQRLRPSAVPPSGNLADTWFEYGKASGGNGSFPSGHAIISFGIATVITQRYKSHRWVPWVAYGVAGLIGFARVPTGDHFPSDVFLGAALGYSIGRFVVAP